MKIMKVVQPIPPRHTITDTGDTLKITINHRLNTAGIIVVIVCLLGGLIIFIAGATLLSLLQNPQALISLSIIMLGWIILLGPLSLMESNSQDRSFGERELDYCQTRKRCISKFPAISCQVCKENTHITPTVRSMDIRSDCLRLWGKDLLFWGAYE
jgi:hypothetical protein